MRFLSMNAAREWDDPFTLEEFFINRLILCLQALSWTFEGWNIVPWIVGEMVNPAEDLPYAIIFGISSVVVLYLFVNLSYSAILGFGAVRTATTIAKSVSDIALPQANFIIPLLIWCSATGALNGTFYGCGCVAMSAGYKGELPKIFSLVHKKSRTPIFASIICFLCACVFLPLNFDDLLNYAAFISWLFYLISMVCLLKIKYGKNKGTSTGKIFEVPVFLVFIFILICIFMIVMSFVLKFIGCSIFLAIILATFGFTFIPLKYRAFNGFVVAQDIICSLMQKHLKMDFAGPKDIS